MSDPDRHGDIETMVAPWVLGALDPAEEEAVRAHVDGCATCREVATRLRRVVGALPLAADETGPPARLRGRVLAAATGLGERMPPTTVTRPRRPAPSPPIAIGFARRIPAYALVAVALVALLTGLVAGQVAFRGGPGPTTSQVVRFSLSGHAQMAGAHASVVELRADGLALVDFRGLPALGQGRVYELWLVPGKGDPVPAGVFVPDAAGAKVVLVDRSLAPYAVMAVTDEPAPDGSVAPTQQPQLYGSVA
jgi:anti-sigma-K factor RskA